MAIEDAGVDQLDGCENQRDFAADGACRIVRGVGLREIEFQRWMDKNEHAQSRRFRPKGFVIRGIEEEALRFRGYDDSGEAQLLRASAQFLQGLWPTERIRMSAADETAGIIALRLLDLVVDEAGSIEIGAHARGRSQERGIDSSLVHHADVPVEVVKQRVRSVTGRSCLVVRQDQAISEIFFE